MKKLMMIMAMVAVIGMAGAPSAFAASYVVAGVNLDFFQAASWTGGVPTSASNVIRWQNSGSMIYDPANQSPGNMVYVAGTTGSNNENGWMPPAGGSYLFTQESGDVEWGQSVNYRPYGMYENATYVLNDGICRFNKGRGIRLLPPAATTALFDHNGGSLIVTPDVNPTDDFGLWMGDDTVGNGSGIYSLAAGTVQTTGLQIGLNGVFNFEAGSTGALYVLTSGRTNSKTAAEIQALIAADDIVDLGGEGFVVTELLAGDYAGYTEVKLIGGAVVPEPAGLGLLGLALLAVRRRRS